MGFLSWKAKGCAALLVFGWGGVALACQPSVTVQAGDNLFSIAEEQLGDASLWSAIFYANPDVQGGSLLDIEPGTVLRIPCADVPAPARPSEPVAEPAPAVVAPTVPQQNPGSETLRLLARSGFPPFTDQKWPAQGMLNALVAAIFEETPNPISHDVSWREDWSRHLFPMIDDKEFDMGFPWFKPDCDHDPGNRICSHFHFSDPMVDVVILLFTRSDASIPFEVDSDLHGRTLCRPAGYFTHDLDGAGREWLTRGLVQLEQPATPEACFEMLMAGDVDAVAVNEFLGVQMMFEMGITADITPLPRPLSVEGLHMVISKSHWRGTTHLYRFNAGLAKLRQSARYNEIVSRHLALFWDQIKG